MRSQALRTSHESSIDEIPHEVYKGNLIAKNKFQDDVT